MTLETFDDWDCYQPVDILEWAIRIELIANDYRAIVDFESKCKGYFPRWREYFWEEKYIKNIDRKFVS